MANPYKKGTDEYLDYATTQHTKATAPKKTMAKKPVAKKTMAKKKDKISEAWAGAKTRQKKWSR